MQTLPNKLYSAEQVREMDRMAIEDHAIPGIDLMRRAGLAIFELIQKHYASTDIVIFCGAGNNAGDGYVVAKLALQSKQKVKVYYLSRPENLMADACHAYQDYIRAGGLAVAFDNPVLTNCIIIDALLGTGLNRKVLGSYADAISLINHSPCPVISVDIPSGLNANTGAEMGHVVNADWTTCFIGLKQGLFTGLAAEHCGQIVFSSLNIPDAIFRTVHYSSILMTQPFLPKRRRCAHKGNNGHVLVVGGEIGFSGAIKLAAEGALRSGAGLVSVATRTIHCGYINIARPELMCHGIEDANNLTPLLDKATVVVIGPGLGQSCWAKSLFKQVVASDNPLVVDADALNLLARQPLHRDNWVLTPHPGEASRLLNCSINKIADDRFSAVSQLQKLYGGIAILKGAGTLIDNGKEITVSTTGNPGMASGGMGDVLAGMIAGLIAQKSSLTLASTAAVYLHGQAADLSAQQAGEIGLLASDLIPFIRKLINK